MIGAETIGAGAEQQLATGAEIIGAGAEQQLDTGAEMIGAGAEQKLVADTPQLLPQLDAHGLPQVEPQPEVKLPQPDERRNPPPPHE